MIEVTIPAGDGAPALPAFAILPPGARRGMVVIHEIYGRTPEIERVVQRFADAGYATVAPELFHRGRMRCLRELFPAMKSGEGIPVTQGRNTRAWLCAETGLDGADVGLVGFCFGGAYALITGPGWGAVSTNYGQVPKPTVMKGIGPVIGCYGKRDLSMRKSPDKLKSALAEVGQDDYEIHTFDAGHSFLTDAKPTLLRRLMAPGLRIGDYPEARAAGWEKILGFFDRKLPAAR